MAVYDMGDVVALGVSIYDANGALANATAVVATVILPDGTTATPSVSNTTLGLYDINFTPTQVGRHVVRWIATGANASAYTDEFTVRDINDMGVVSLDEVKQHLNITTTDQDEELRRFMDAAGDLADNYCGQVLGRKTFTDELYDGNTDHLRLRNPRAITILSVYENGYLLNPGQYALDPTGQRLYRVGSGTLYATNSCGFWTGGMQNISVSYVAGWFNPPAAVKQGVLEIIRHLWQTQRGAMNVMTRNQSGDDFYSSSTYSLPRRAMELLDPASLPGLA